MLKSKPLHLPNVPKKCKGLSLLLALAYLAFVPLAIAQQDSSTEAPPEDPDVFQGVELQDNLGRDTPRSSITGFLLALESFDYELAANYMDMRNLPRSVRKISGEELAKQLDFIIKRGMGINVNLLSKKPSGQLVDGLPEYRDEFGRVQSEDGELVLYLQKVPGPEDGFIWKISNASIPHIPELYDFYSYPGWVDKVRERLPEDASFLGIEAYKWTIIFGVAVLSAPVFWAIGFVLSWLTSRPGSPLHQPIRRLFTRPLPLFAVGLLTNWFLQELGLGAFARRLVEANTLMTIIALWIVFSLIDLARAKRRQKFIAQGRVDAHVLGRPMANALKLFALLAGILFWLSSAGVNITTLLAGLGVGGVALALALQKPIEDLLGAISIYSQQPIQTGDLCKYGPYLGCVEEIGLRTTRIRTLANTVVHVPNALIAHREIENYSARMNMLYHPELPLRYDTNEHQMQAIIDGIGQMARTHDSVLEDSVRVKFTEFTENALIIRARIYVDTSDFSTYLAVVGELNMAIMKIVQDAGAHFAQGAKTIMLEGAAGAPS